MFRNYPEYRKLLNEFDHAVVGVGCDDGIPENLVGRVKLDGIEPLMMATYRMQRYIRDYMAQQNIPFQFGIKFPDLFTALDLALRASDQSKKTHYLMDEADAMEMLSRACYAWLKCYQRLDPKIRNRVIEKKAMLPPNR